MATNFSLNEYLTIDTTGSVGIGTNVPLSRLHVTGSNSTTLPTVILKAGTASQNSGAAWPNAGVGIFDIQNSAGTSLLFVSGSGFVGIGTTAWAYNDPGYSYRLNVEGDIALHTSNDSAGVSTLRLGSSATIPQGIATVVGTKTATSAGYMSFYTTTGGSQLERMRIFATGEVGIGTTVSNGNKLSVNGTTAITGSALPGVTNTYDLGSSGMKWRTVYATNLTGSHTQLSDGTSYLLGGTGINVTTGSNGAVTHSIKDSIVATISGSTFTGAVKFSGGLSGSLTTLANGDPYLLAGTSISLSTGSSGAVTIAILPTAGSITGTGTANYSAIFTDTSTIGNGLVYDDGTKVGIGVGTTTFTGKLYVSGSSTGTTTTLLVKHGIANGSNLPVLDVQNSAGTSLLFVSGSGGVGIGTATPAVTGFNFKPLAYDSTNAYIGTMTPSGGAYTSGFIAFGDTAGSKYVRMVYAGSATAANEVATIDFGGTNRLAIGAALYINSTTGNWNVGIGGTNPLSRFEVTGSGATSATSTMNLLNSSNTSLLFVRDDGNVGIGSSSPGYKLTVGGTVYATAFSGSLTQLATGGAYLLAGTNVTLSTGSSGAVTINANLAGGAVSGAGTANYVPLWSTTTSVTNSSIYDSGAGVGIGTTTFTGRLYVSGSSTGTTTTLLARHGVAAGSNLPVLDVQNSAGTSLLFVSGSGTIGIGTTALDSRLNVYTTNANNTDGLRIFGGAVQNNVRIRPSMTSAANNPIVSAADSGIIFDGGTIDTGNFVIAPWISSTIPSGLRMNATGDITVGIGSAAASSARIFISGSTTASTPTMIVREGAVSPTAGVGVLNVQNSAGTSLFFVSGSGNVGIGLTTPTARLYVTGSVTGSTTTLLVRHGVASGSNLPVLDVQNSASASLLFVSGNGYVGIGTSTPAARVDIFGVSGSIFSVTDALSGSLLAVTSVSGLPIFEVFSDSRIIAGASGQNVFVVSGSQVGIGTSTPTAALHVQGILSSSITTSVVRAGYSSTGGAGVLNVQNSAGASILFVTGSGLVGIGVSTPTAVLHVTGSASTSATTAIIKHGSSRLQAGAVLDVQEYGGNTLLFVSGSSIANGGPRVGIGTATPATYLSVPGSISLGTPRAVSAATYTVLITDYSIRFSAACTVTLPTASSFTGRVLILTSYNNFAITSASSNVTPINSSTPGTALVATGGGKFAMIQSDGSTWITLMSN